MLQKLEGITSWLNDEDFTHIHEDASPPFTCHNPACDLWVWQDAELQSSVPKKWSRWAYRSYLKTILAIQISIKRDMKLNLGPTVTVPGTEKKVKLAPIIKIVMAYLAATGISVGVLTWFGIL